MNKIVSEEESKSVYTEKFKIKSYETDETGKASIQSICGYFQEVGFNHAALLMSGFASVDKNTAYVLTRLHVIISKYPSWKDEIEIRTWLSPLEGNYAVRNFEVFDSAGDVICTGENSALFFDLLRRKPVPIPEEAKTIPVFDKRALNDDFRRMEVPDMFDDSILIDVRLNDIDTYRHVNNVTYVDWAVDAVPVEIRRKSGLREIEIAFLAETDFPETVVSEISFENDGKFIHRITRKSDGKTAALLKTLWSPLVSA